MTTFSPNSVQWTFDDGPSIYTLDIARLLHREELTATFFFIGEKLHTHDPAIVMLLREMGHDIGNHTWSHPQLPKQTEGEIREEIDRCQCEIIRAGATPTKFRPPYGDHDERVRDEAHAQGLDFILWDVDPRDWTRPGAEVIADRVREHSFDGATILMHDGGGDRSQTLAAVEELLK